MKKFLLIFFTCAGLVATAQNYNNEWIDYNKTYYKFKIGATGLYRISQSTLSGIGLGTVPAEHFQLWRNGQEIPLYTSVQSGPLGGSDYIEFWGEMNDGLPDNVLYRNPDFQLNDKWSLQTDTAAFFLTVNPAGNNFRLVPTANNLPTALAPETYFMYTAGSYPKTRMNSGYAAVVGEYVYSSAYDQGEGWTSSELTTNNTFTNTLSGLQPYTGAGAPDATVRIHASGNALNPRQFEIRVNNNLVATQTMDFFDYVKGTYTVPASMISTGSAAIATKNICATANDRMVLAKVEMTYARRFHFGGTNNFLFELPASATEKYLEIQGFSHGNVIPVLYDLTNGKRYPGNITPSTLVRVLLEPSAVPRKLLLVTQHSSYPKAVTALEQRNFINYADPAMQGDYLIISHPALMTSSGGANPVEEYRDYRSSTAGGSHAAKIYLADELVDQFGFGIKKHPMGIRNFIRWARNTYSSPVHNVLLVGKGLTYNQFRLNESKPEVDRLNFVPTFGNPASDNMLAVDPSINLVPQVSIGRISAINGDEIRDYLDKVIQYEQAQAFSSPLIQDRAWLKNTVNVIGASDAALGTILTAAMDRYKNILSDTLYGANVSTFSKVSAAPVEQASSEKLYNLFQEGFGMMTYFGHSSASTLEFNLDNPDQYNNAGKYPVTIVMGCNAGNFYNYNTLRLYTKETLSEKFVLAKQRGSIAFIASSHFGIVHYLDILNTRSMTAASVSKYGKTLGEIFRESIQQVYNLTTQNDYYARFHCEQTTIHGDPALRLDGSTEKPDYVIEDPLIKITPNFISIAETQFNVSVKMLNIGKAINRDIVVEVRRTYPDQSVEIIRRDTIPGIRYSDSLSFDVLVVGLRDKGLNKITICVDADNTTDELFETNNCITRDIFIFEDEARPIHPYTYSIVNKQDIKLMASTANPFSGLKQYVMEIDTTEFFNSPLKATQTISSEGGLLEFTPGITFTDSTVYYWRVAPVPATGQPTWNKTSFVYLSPSGPNASEGGFNQSHFYQHTKSSFDGLNIDSATRKMNFGTIYNNLFLRMGTWVTSGATQEAALSVAINGAAIIRVTNFFQSLVFNVIDPLRFKPWINEQIFPATFPAYLGEGYYKSATPRFGSSYRPYNFEFRYTDPVWREKAMNFMKDTIPDGHYVVIRNFSLDPATYPNPVQFPQVFINQWLDDTLIHGSGNSLYHLLRNTGFAGIDSFYRVRPWGFVYKKNDPSFTPKWLVGDGSLDNPTYSVDCPTPDTLGHVKSPVFGPAREWKQVKWRGSEQDNWDVVSLDVIGIRSDGTEEVVVPGLTTAQQEYDISSVNPDIFPRVRLRLNTMDSVEHTPYQLRYWRVTYTPVPEGALSPHEFFSLRDTLDVGEPLDYKIAFRNVSEVPFDSLKLKLVVTDQNNVQHIIPVPRRRPLLVNDTLHIGDLINTQNLSGHNIVFLEANPDNDQPEQYHFNNFAYRDFYVKPDSIHPLLDVTFDGVHILNRDIVSSKPDILVKLKDEAKWMILDDTSLLTLHVRYPDGSLKRYYFNSDTLVFQPAGQAPNPDNTASVNFRPYFPEDGEYELIVTGKDRSNNAAGNIEYRVLFEVINKPMISNMLNYPNPFTTSTAFVFTITGSEVPQNIKIEIMTITGRIVREITKDELGPLHIGRNITEFKWDGTDQYGQKLANGIYLYRVVTNLNGKSLDKYKGPNDNTDKYFNKGYGKMYLMR